MGFDCIVVGGGLLGMLTARELARDGAQVLLIDKSSTGREASWAGGGILSPLYPWKYSDQVTALARWSQHHYEQFSLSITEETGIDPEYTASGLLMLVDENTCAQGANWARLNEIPFEVYRAQQLHGLEPALVETHQLGFWLPEVAQIRNPRLTKALRASLDVHAVRVLEGEAVQEVVTQQGAVVGVRTDKNTFHAEKVVLAAGAWSAAIAAQLNLDIRVQPVKGQMIILQSASNLLQKIILSENRYVIPRRDGRVLVGSTLEYVGFNKSTTDKAREELQDFAVRLLPVLGEYQLEHHWSGLRPGAPEGIPYIGKCTTIKGLYVNAGHFRNGVVLGLASARLLADLVLARPPIVDPTGYSLDRDRAYQQV